METSSSPIAPLDETTTNLEPTVATDAAVTPEAAGGGGGGSGKEMVPGGFDPAIPLQVRT